jgi:hypothetical protein
MDVVTSANGNANQDIRCYASGKGQQKDWHQVYVADVLVHKCVAVKGYETCGECPDKNSCKKVGAIWENCAEAKENLNDA